MKKTQKLRKAKGITLISLVVSIIVLIVLAGVTISTVLGENGILSSAKKAKEQTQTASEKEQLEMAYTSLYIKEQTKPGSLTDEKLINEIQTKLGATVEKVEENGKTSYKVTMPSGKTYVLTDGQVTEMEKENIVVGTKEDWKITEDGVITQYLGIVPENGVLIVPNYVENIKVKSIENEADVYASIIKNDKSDVSGFYNSSVKKLIISEGIEKIGGYWSFGSMENLESVSIPGTVKEITYRTFAGCTKLKSINIPEGVTTIGYGVFENCTALETIVIPKTVNTFKDSVFRNCTSLKNICYNGTIEEWNKITIDKSNTEITTATITVEGNKKINVATKEDWEITDEGVITGYIGSIPEDGVLVFPTYIDGIKVISIENKISDESIIKNRSSDNTGYYNSTIKEIIISEGIEKIDGYWTFAKMENLEAIYLPSSLSSIGGNAVFFKCEMLQHIYYAGTAEQWDNIKISSPGDFINAGITYEYKYN